MNFTRNIMIILSYNFMNYLLLFYLTTFQTVQSLSQNIDPIKEDTIYDVLDLYEFKFFYRLDSSNFTSIPLSYETQKINLEKLNFEYQIRPYPCHQYDYNFVGPENCDDTSYVYGYGMPRNCYEFIGATLMLGSVKEETIFIGMGFENDSTYIQLDSIKFNNKTSLVDIQRIFPNSYKQKRVLHNGYWGIKEELISIELHPHSLDYYSHDSWPEDKKYDWKRIWNEAWILFFKDETLIAITFKHGT